MPIFYQKHRQIDAFQFDGTWLQLRQKLPTDIWEMFLRAYQVKDANPATDTEISFDFDQKHYLQAVYLNQFDERWPQVTVKNHGALKAQRYLTIDQNHNRWSPKHAEQSWSKPTKRIITMRNLYVGDYIYWTTTPTTMVDYAGRGKWIKTYVQQSWMHIKSPKTFLSHWSKKPI